MGGSAVKKVVVSFVLFIVMSVCVLYGAIFILKNVYKPPEKDRLTLLRENDEVREESRKLDPEEGKIVLTDKVLASEYRFTYEDKRSGQNSYKTAVYLGAGFFLFVFAFSFVSVFCASHFSFKKSFTLLIPMALIVGALWFLEPFGFWSRKTCLRTRRSRRRFHTGWSPWKLRGKGGRMLINTMRTGVSLRLRNTTTFITSVQTALNMSTR